MSGVKRSQESEAKRKRYREERFLNFGARIQAAMAHRAIGRGGNYSYADLARELAPRLAETPVRAIGVDATTVGLWRRNEQRPSLEKILLMAEVLHVDPGWLAFGSWAHKAGWPAWVVGTWPETGGETPGEREARSRPAPGGRGRHHHTNEHPYPVAGHAPRGAHKRRKRAG